MKKTKNFTVGDIVFEKGYKIPLLVTAVGKTSVIAFCPIWDGNPDFTYYIDERIYSLGDITLNKEA